MRYFELLADKETSNPVKLLKIDGNVYKNGLTAGEYSAIPPLAVGYYENSPHIEIYDVLEEPAFLISDKLKRLFALYEPKMEFKGIQLFPTEMEDKNAPLYWLPYVYPVDCLSPNCRKYPNGMLRDLVLDLRVPLKHSIFRVTGILEHKLIVSLPVAESMIRRNMSGFTLVPAVFSGEESDDENHSA